MEDFERPSTRQCVKKVKQLSKTNWLLYVGSPGGVMDGHILPYPIAVQKNGNLTDMMHTNGVFPDFENAKISGNMMMFSKITSKITG